MRKLLWKMFGMRKLEKAVDTIYANQEDSVRAWRQLETKVAELEHKVLVQHKVDLAMNAEIGALKSALDKTQQDNTKLRRQGSFDE